MKYDLSQSLASVQMNRSEQPAGASRKIAALIVFLGSPVNRQITGEIIRITGGR
jgi:hypothetical protein